MSAVGLHMGCLPSSNRGWDDPIGPVVLVRGLGQKSLGRVLGRLLLTGTLNWRLYGAQIPAHQTYLVPINKNPMVLTMHPRISLLPNRPHHRPWYFISFHNPWPLLGDNKLYSSCNQIKKKVPFFLTISINWVGKQWPADSIDNRWE